MKTLRIICALGAISLQFAATAYAQGNFNVENNTVPQEWTNRAKEGAPAQSQAEVDYRDRQAAILNPRPADRRDWGDRGRLPDYPRGDRPGSVREQPAPRVGSPPANGSFYSGGRVPPERAYPGSRNPSDHAHPGGHGPYDGAFQPGSRVPPAYRGYGYVIDDWRGHRLSPPPRGYQWVQSGADYLLVDVRTGTVSQVLRGR